MLLLFLIGFFIGMCVSHNPDLRATGISQV